MNKEVQIIISAKDLATRVVSGLGRQMQSFTSSVSSQLTQVTSKFADIGRTAQQLTLPATIATGAMVAAGNELVKTAHQAQMGGLLFNNMATRAGENIAKLGLQVKELSDDLKVPDEVIRQNAAELLRYGYSFDQIEDIYRGAAASAMLVGKSTVEGIDLINQALVTEMSVYLNQIGIIENLSPALQKYAEGLGKTKDELTDAERRQAAYNMIVKATEAEVKDMPTLFKGYGGAVADFTNEMYKARVELGKELLPIWTSVIQKGTDLVRQFNELNPAQKEFIYDVGKMAAMAIGAAAGLGLMASGAGLAIKAIGMIAGVISIVTSPMVIGMAAIGAAAYLAYTAWTENWGGIQEKTEAVWEKVKPIIDEMGKGIKVAVEWLADKGRDVFEFVKEKVFPAVAQGVAFTVNVSFQLIGEIFESLKTAFATGEWGPFFGVASDIWSSGVFLYLSVMKAKEISSQVRTILDTIKKSFGPVLSQFGVVGFLGIMTVGVQLVEAIAQGTFEKFGKNLMLALAAGIGVGLFNPQLGILTFNVVLNFKLGENLDSILSDIGKQIDSSLAKWYENIPKFNMEGFYAVGRSVRNFFDLNGSEKKDILFKHEGEVLPGKSGPDQFLAMLAPGEAVVPAFAVQQGWPAVLKWFKDKGVPGFQAGGNLPKISTGDFSLDSMFVSTAAMLDNMSKTFSQIGKVFMAVLEKVGQITGKVLEFVLGAEKFAQLKGLFDDLTALFKQLFNYGTNQPPVPQEYSPYSVKPRVIPEGLTAGEPSEMATIVLDSWAKMTSKLEKYWKDMVYDGKEMWQSIVDKFRDVKEWMSKPLYEKWADIKAAFKASEYNIKNMFAQGVELLGRVGSGLTGQVVGQAPVLGSVIQGATQGAAGGPMGMAAGALVGLISESETFQQLMANLNPILQMTADTFGKLIEPILPVIQVLGQALAPILSVFGTILAQLIVPVMRPLFEGLKILGAGVALIAAGFYGLLSVVYKLSEGIMRALSWVFDVLPGFDDLEAVTAKLANQFAKQSSDAAQQAEDQLNAAGDLITMSWEEAMARAKNTEEINKSTQALKNLPDIFKINLERFKIVQPEEYAGQSRGRGYTPAYYGSTYVPSYASQTSNNLQVTITVPVSVAGPVYGVNDLDQRIYDTASKAIKDANSEFEKAKKGKCIVNYSRPQGVMS